MKAHEVKLGDHHQIPTLSKIGPILELFREDIAGIDGAWNVNDAEVTINDGFADFAFAEIGVFHHFVCWGGGTGDACLVITVDCDLVEGIAHAKVLDTMFDVENFLGAFVGGHDFGFTGALVGLLLSDGALGDGSTTVIDEVAGERSILEEFDRGTVGDGVAKLATPVCITESCRLMDFRW